MAKTRNSKTNGAKPARKTARKARFQLFVFTLFVLLIVAAVIYWQAPRIQAYLTALWEGIILRTVGIGVYLVAFGVLVALGIILSRRFNILAKFWNWWLVGLAWWFAAFGVLAFFRGSQGILRDATLGGVFGEHFILGGSAGLIGGLRCAGLIILGAIFISPRLTLRVLSKLASRAGKLYLRYPLHTYLLRLIWLSFAWLGKSLLWLLKAPFAPRAKKPATASTPAPTTAAGTKKTAVPTPVTPAPDTGAQATTPGTSSVPSAKPLGAPSASPKRWVLPPIQILKPEPTVVFGQVDNEKRARLIEQALASYGVEAKVAQINPGPTVTQFGVEPGWDRKFRQIVERDHNGKVKVGKNGKPLAHAEELSRTRVKIERINSLANDLALVLAVPSIRIEAPVPGKSLVGLEVPNTTSGIVTLRGVIETPAFQKLLVRTKLALGLGKGSGGEIVAADLTKMPHLLIAGATGSGKTVCINSIIACLLMHNTPDEIRLLLIDPKRVELTNYNNIPHLLTPVMVDAEEAVKALRRVLWEMDSRYRRFAAVSARNIEAYNRSPQVNKPLPYVVVVIDELADLMMSAPDVVEPTLCRLAQLARATGIHMAVATQRPSVDVITGLIKANFPTRISFAVTSQVDSRTILDSIGAEKLLGYGDMLYMPTDAAKPKRLQGTLTSDEEIERLIQFWINQAASTLGPDEFAESFAALENRSLEVKDPLLEKARQLTSEYSRISISLLQRRLHIGYSRAARIMDALEEEGIAGSGERGDDPQTTSGDKL